ncbi:transglutaminase [Bifidobacterium goeldii]|uniref:Transglutaminase n=1 Tax=Bifidobacterium goeldii TaxID=2306975 RepID=A0A430FKG3_9BIFI|nr:transglutaminase-like domain-containing protein [Bifidobacterium goeldii]RSX53270.1 transglutaminase [Bifidobacterium goeldii]
MEGNTAMTHYEQPGDEPADTSAEKTPQSQPRENEPTGATNSTEQPTAQPTTQPVPAQSQPMPYPPQGYPQQAYPGQPQQAYPSQQPYPGQPYAGQPYPGQAQPPYQAQPYAGQPYGAQPQSWPSYPQQAPQSQQPYPQQGQPYPQYNPQQPYPQQNPNVAGHDHRKHSTGKHRPRWWVILIAAIAAVALVAGCAFAVVKLTGKDSTASNTDLPTAEQAYGSALPASKYDLKDPISVDIYHEFRIYLKGKVTVEPDSFLVSKLKNADMTVYDCAKIYQDASLSVPIPTSAFAFTPSDGDDDNGTIDISGSMDIPEYMQYGDSISKDLGFLPSDGYYYVQYMGSDGKKLTKPIVQFFKVANPTGVQQLDPVSGITPVVNSEGGVDISWNKLEGAKSYNVYTYIVLPQIGQPGDDNFSEERTEITKIGSSKTTQLLSKDYDEVKSSKLLDNQPETTYSQNEAFHSLAVEDQDYIDACTGSTRDYCVDVLEQAGGSYNPDSAGKLYFVVSGVDAEGHESRWRAVDANDIVPSIPIGPANQTQHRQWIYNSKGVFGEDNTLEEDMEQYVYTFVTMANGSTATIPSTFSEINKTGNASWNFLVSAPGTKITNTGHLYYEGDLNAIFPQIQQAALESLPKAGGVLDRVNAVTGNTDWSGYDTKKIDSDTKQSPYFIFASTDYGKYLANNILNGHEVIDITKYATDDYQVSTDDVMTEIIYQNPYMRTDSDGISFAVRKKGDKTVMWVKYPDNYKQRQKTMADFVNANVSKFQGSDRDKAIAIEQFLAGQMTYDYDAINFKRSGGTDSASAFDSIDASKQYPDAWSPYGMVSGKGVCMSYAYAYQLLGKAAGLDTRVVSGSVSGYSTSHAWNYVKIDGKWLVIDATWDDDGNTAGTKYQLKDKSEVTDHFAFNDGWTLASQSGQY